MWKWRCFKRAKYRIRWRIFIATIDQWWDNVQLLRKDCPMFSGTVLLSSIQDMSSPTTAVTTPTSATTGDATTSNHVGFWMQALQVWCFIGKPSRPRHSLSIHSGCSAVAKSAKSWVSVWVISRTGSSPIQRCIVELASWRHQITISVGVHHPFLTESNKILYLLFVFFIPWSMSTSWFVF